MTYKLQLKAAFRRFQESQMPNNLQNSITQAGTSATRQQPAAEIAKFQQFDAESGAYKFNSATGSMQVPPSQMLSNGRLAVGQKVLISQGTADFIPK